MSRTPKPRAEPHRPWRDALESAVAALVVALLLKAFAVEAYRIPSGSMQPTLLGFEGPDGGTAKDRVLVDRLAYTLGDPERFDVAVFRFPLDAGRAFVKRIWGMPGDTLRISNGDVQQQQEDGTWKALQRPAKVMSEMWLDLDPGGWERRAGSLDFECSEFTPGADGRIDLVYPRGALEDPGRQRVVDLYRDGYPTALAGQLPFRGGDHVVGDLRVDFRIDGSPGEIGELKVTIGEAAASGYVVTHTTDALTLDLPRRSVQANEIPLLSVESYAFENLDDRVRFWRGDELLFDEPVDAVKPTQAWVRVEVTGKARLDRLLIRRDVHYILGGAAQDTWTVPEGEYFVLGDNTQASVDSRMWRLAGYEFTDGPRAGDVVLGQVLQGENPRTSFAREEGPEWYFRDRFGERQRIPTWQIRMTRPTEAPFVPRENMIGRAFAVVWPLGRGLDRPRWVR